MLFLSFDTLEGALDGIWLLEVYRQPQSLISSTKPFLLTRIMEMDTEHEEPFFEGGHGRNNIIKVMKRFSYAKRQTKGHAVVAASKLNFFVIVTQSYISETADISLHSLNVRVKLFQTINAVPI